MQQVGRLGAWGICSTGRAFATDRRAWASGFTNIERPKASPVYHASGSSALKTDHKRKIVELAELIGILDQHRASGEVIVQCHGCFDIVHPGHLRYLEFARRQGDLLVVTLTGDAAIEKGEQRPHIPQELRAESLAALEFVDYVYIDPSPTAESVLEALKPNIYVKGREYETSRDERFLSEKSIVESKGGKVIFSSGDVVFSSTKLIDSIQSDEGLTHQRLAAVCARHKIDQLVIRYVADGSTRAAMLEAGEVDLIAANQIPTTEILRLGDLPQAPAAPFVPLHPRAPNPAPNPRVAHHPAPAWS